MWEKPRSSHACGELRDNEEPVGQGGYCGEGWVHRQTARGAVLGALWCLTSTGSQSREVRRGAGGRDPSYHPGTLGSPDWVLTTCLWGC